jgi:predicted site-specific integrase-resolvase
MDDVINLKIKYIYITHKDRLTRMSFKTIQHLFSKYGTNIIIISNISNDNEIFEELISLMHIFSTTMYSNRRKNKINIFKSDIENFISTD